MQLKAVIFNSLVIYSFTAKEQEDNGFSLRLYHYRIP